MSRNGSILRNVDWLTIGMFLMLALFGWMNIYGASYTFEQTSIFDFSNRAGKQFVWIMTALLMGSMILLIDSKTYEVLAYILYGVVLLVLLATPFLAHNVKGSYSWISLGPISLQPAEIAKCVTALAVAKYMGRYEYKLRGWRDLIIPFALIGIPMLIIMVMQRETGSALVFASFLLVFYRQGMTGLVLLAGVLAAVIFIIVVRFSWIPAIVLITICFTTLYLLYRKERKVWVKWLIIGAFFVYVGYTFMCNYAFQHVFQSHQRERIEVLLGMKDDPGGAGYNVNQSKIAIGSGRFFGKGYLQGTQTKLRFVPEQDTDFIFCTVGEEWGFVGSAGVLLLYMAFLLRMVYLAERQRDTFSQI